MQLLSIGVSDKYDAIWSQLQKQYNKLNDSKISLNVEKTNENDTNYIVCNVDEDGTNIGYISENVRLATINVLTDYIIDQYEQKIINRIVNTNYCYFNLSERKEIVRIAIKGLHDIDNENILSSLYIIRRKNIIMRKLVEYFQNNGEINIEGFVNFRLQDYIKELEGIVEKAVDDYLMEREYKEFIKLLKYFVEVQESKLHVIHIIVESNSKYVLLDQDEREITNQCIKDFMTEIKDGELNYDDLLVSSLITLAPKNIIIHGVKNMKNKELLDTINNVFMGKVKVCEHCKICLSDKYMIERSPK